MTNNSRSGRPAVVLWREEVHAARNLSTATRLLAYTLGQYMSALDATCHVGMRRLADDLGVHPKTVARGRDCLVDAGLLVVLEVGVGTRASRYAAAFPSGGVDMTSTLEDMTSTLEGTDGDPQRAHLKPLARAFETASARTTATKQEEQEEKVAAAASSPETDAATASRVGGGSGPPLPPRLPGESRADWSRRIADITELETASTNLLAVFPGATLVDEHSTEECTWESP